MNTELMFATALLASAFSEGAGYMGPFTRPTFNGNCRCKNCGKATFKSDVCDLRCLSQWKSKQKQEE